MARYVDGFVLPVPKNELGAYRKLATTASRVWREHGALEYIECVGEDLKVKGMVSFLPLSKAKAGETVILAWIVYTSKAHRDRVNKKVMADPRVKAMMQAASVFDMKRMAYGGFKVIVDA